MKRVQIGWLAFTLLLFSYPLHAHSLRVFVYAAGDWLHGSTYFTGGVAASGAKIRILDSSDLQLAELIPDEQGEFKFQVLSRDDYRVVADTGDGHRAEWQVAASELGAELPYAESMISSVTEKNAIISSTFSVSGSTETALPDPALAALVEQSVARQIGPLRKALQAHNDEVRLADILGGIGFIFGLAGVLLWWRNRR